ncbi:hypothetical protein PYW07_003979 [Mythimna separata]|uniref:HAP1 N-terminal domain-containing protein n=1 Tax=Mythimna separata TaxID=271217 RepID=A0AAD7YQ03_MYTSE|nr:hypothetical protein PYW07_003979 [Mythimna separata]
MTEKRHRPRPRRRDELHDRQQDLLLAWSHEVCNSEEVPEVEIVSLLQEHIPKYRLRADSLTQFGGYENQDWFIPSPALPVSDKDLALTPDQIRETLNYFPLRLREHRDARPPVPVAPVATRHAPSSPAARRNGPIDTATPKRAPHASRIYAPTRAKLRE